MKKYEIGGVPLNELAPKIIKVGAVVGFFASVIVIKSIF